MNVALDHCVFSVFANHSIPLEFRILAASLQKKSRIMSGNTFLSEVFIKVELLYFRG